MNVCQTPNKKLFKSTNIDEAYLWYTFSFIDCGALELIIFIMKTLIVLLLSVFIYACSDNPVTNNNSPNPTADTVILFTKDSINVGSGTFDNDSVSYDCTVDVDILHINFTVQSENVQKINFMYLTNAVSYDSTLTLPTVYSESFHFTVSVNSQSFNTLVKLLLMNIYQQPCYASLRNIRLWYIRRN